MAPRLTPPGEDPLRGSKAVSVPFGGSFREPTGAPAGEDGLKRAQNLGGGTDELENVAQQIAAVPDGVDDHSAVPEGVDFLGLVSQAEQQASLYTAQSNRRAWTQSLRAFHNEHHVGSKYTKPDWRGRSKLFIPKTRGAVRKDMAAVAASLFNSIDAINCLPGNEGDPRQRAAAALMQQIVNYRTDSSNGNAAFPWFLVALGARQDADLMGVCGSVQEWKREYRKTGSEQVMSLNPETNVYEARERATYTLESDRPDMKLFPAENYTIDPSANWLNPAQSAAYFIIHWPMQPEEIRRRQDDPVKPWKEVPLEVMQSATQSAKSDMEAIRRARENGFDRFDETQTGTSFQIVWVSQVFIRVDGEDWTFYSIGDQVYLTDPTPVRDEYPEQYGERPIALGYGQLEAHRINPMAAAESWQPLQIETNDLRNLMLDATKQNVMPISKVRRGRQIDMDQVRRRSSGSSILVQDPDDVTWEQPPAMPAQAQQMSRELSIEFDDLAGQQNYGNVEQSNALGKTLGGLKLAAGAANAVQEFDIRVWIETWATPALSQIVRLEQYHESDATVLGLCGERAQLWVKHGINKIDDELLKQKIMVRVSVGLGAGDPQQRLAKFQTAASIVGPIAMQSPDFQSGKKEIDIEAIWEEVFGAAGYRDGGKRFIKDNGQPRANPMADLKTKELLAKIAKDERTGQGALFGGLAQLAKVALGKKELEAAVVDSLLSRQVEARSMGFDHAHRHHEQHLSAIDHGHRHGMEIADHRRNLKNDAAQQAMADAEQDAPPSGGAGGGAEMEGAAAPASSAAPSGMGSSTPSSAPSSQALMQLLAEGKLEFTRGADGRISGIRLPHGGSGQYPQPQQGAA